MKTQVHLWDQMVLIGFGLALFYTVFDSVLYIVVGAESSLSVPPTICFTRPLCRSMQGLKNMLAPPHSHHVRSPSGNQGSFAFVRVM